MQNTSTSRTSPTSPDTYEEKPTTPIPDAGEPPSDQDAVTLQVRTTSQDKTTEQQTSDVQVTSTKQSTLTDQYGATAQNGATDQDGTTAHNGATDQDGTTAHNGATNQDGTTAHNGATDQDRTTAHNGATDQDPTLVQPPVSVDGPEAAVPKGTYMIGTNLKLCPCKCPGNLLNKSTLVEKSKLLSAKIAETLPVVNSSDLSSTVRKRKSAPDARPSSACAGAMAAILLGFVLAVLTSADVVTVGGRAWYQVSCFVKRRCIVNDESHNP